MQICNVDYRTAYVVVGNTVRAASRSGIPGMAITGAMIDEAALAHTGHSWDLAGRDLSAVLDPAQIVLSRTAQGGAAPDALRQMVDAVRPQLGDLAEAAIKRSNHFDQVDAALLEQAREAVAKLGRG